MAAVAAVAVAAAVAEAVAVATATAGGGGGVVVVVVVGATSFFPAPFPLLPAGSAETRRLLPLLLLLLLTEEIRRVPKASPGTKTARHGRTNRPQNHIEKLPNVTSETLLDLSR